MQHTQKVGQPGPGGGGLGYEPLIMSDRSVYDLARCGCTQEDIAALFNVTRETMLKHHQVAFDLGKLDMKRRPRLKLYHFLDALEEQVHQSLAETGEFALDENGDEVRKVFNTSLGRLYLDTIAQTDKYLPRELKVELTKNPFAELSDEELAAKIAAAQKGLK